jgi:hypothetical protein
VLSSLRQADGGTRPTADSYAAANDDLFASDVAAGASRPR